MRLQEEETAAVRGMEQPPPPPPPPPALMLQRGLDAGVVRAYPVDVGGVGASIEVGLAASVNRV
jgi:hypothetical protein